MLQKAVKEKEKHYTAQKKWALLFLIFLDPFKPFDPQPLTEILICKFELQISLLCSITYCTIACQTMKNK